MLIGLIAIIFIVIIVTILVVIIAILLIVVPREVLPLCLGGARREALAVAL